MSPISFGAIHALGELALDVVAGDCADASQVGIDRRIVARTNEIAEPISSATCGHSIIVFENAAEPAPVAAAWRGRQAEQRRIRIGRR